MGGPSLAVILVTLLLEIIAFGLALGAMTRRSKASVAATSDKRYFYCHYSNGSIASGLAAGSIIFLLLGHAVIMGVTRCFCCRPGSSRGKARACAILSFTLAWIFFIISELLLIGGASINNYRTKDRTYLAYDDGTPRCKEIRKSVFGAGAAFTFLTLLFSEIYYFSLVKASDVPLEQPYKGGAPTIGMTAYP